jgi:hypothetical protein
MKPISLLRMAALAAACVCLAPPAAVADDIDKKTVVTISQPTEAPGIVLQPGKYVIKLLNSSSNRHIAEIMNERMDHLYALTFTAAAERINPGEKAILTFYEGSSGQPQALRKWFWPGETIGQEFIYPKNQAARISAASKQKVPEGNLPTIAESGQSLTPDNANGASLESRVENNVENKSTPAPLVARAAEDEPKPAPPTVIAQNTPPPAPARTDDETRTAPPANSVSTASSSDNALPQTASPLPLIGAIGIISLALAAVLGSVKRRSL